MTALERVRSNEKDVSPQRAYLPLGPLPPISLSDERKKWVPRLHYSHALTILIRTRQGSVILRFKLKAKS
jgi:hypothetical protein